MARRVVLDACTLEGVSGEVALVATRLRQVIVDLESPQPHIRAEAVDFLADDEAVAFWTQLIGVDPQAWQAYARRALQRTGEA
jgi:hypothetical protein